MAKQDLKKMAEKMVATKEIVKRSNARDLDTMPSKGVKKLATTPNVSERMGKDPSKMLKDRGQNRMAAFYGRRAANLIEDDKEVAKSFSPNKPSELRSIADSLSREADADSEAYERYKKLTKKVEVPKIETTTKKKK